MAKPKFQVGQLVRHRLFFYRGVIVDAHAKFEGDDEWYDHVAQTRPPKDAPWYEVLPDGVTHQTYVAERNLELDDCHDPIRHPMVSAFFRELVGGRYRVGGMVN